MRGRTRLLCGQTAVAGLFSQFADASADEGVEAVGDLEGVGPAVGENGGE
jgi:hypothetical protein